jgi:hypothetical protein
MVDMLKKTQRFDKRPQERRRSQNGGHGIFASWVRVLVYVQMPGIAMHLGSTQ